MKEFIYLLSFMLLSVLVSSCEKDEQPPMNGTKMPISLAIVVIDKDSVNLLNDSITRAEYIKNMRFIYRDSSFACSGEIKKPIHTDGAFWGYKNNKYLSSIDLKIRDCYDKNWMPYTYYAFVFGEFGPNENFQDETIIIDWGDGNTDEIRFTYTDNTSAWYLNGKKNEHQTSFYIIRE